jgi:hypothetical protein
LVAAIPEYFTQDNESVHAKDRLEAAMEGAAFLSSRHFEPEQISPTYTDLVTVVIVLVPIVFGAPPVLVFIPPAMLLAPAALARFVQFTTFVIRLTAMASMVLDGLVQVVLGVRNSPLAAINVFGMKSRHCSEEQTCCQDRS